MDKLKPYLPWFLRLAVLLVVVVLVFLLNSARGERDRLRREIEGEKLKTQGFIVEVQKTKAEMAELERKLLAENAWLENEVQRLKDELGKKPKIKIIERWNTLPGLPGGVPLQIPCENGKTVACYFPEGATGHIEATGLTYETKDKNLVLVGTADFWRDTPEPKALIYTARLDPVKTSIFIDEGVAPGAEKTLGWGWGARAWADSLGWGAGPVVAFPPFPFLFGTQIELSADFTVGTPWPMFLADPGTKVPAILLGGGLSAILRGK